MYAQLPMFTRIGAAAFKKDLTNTLALCDILGNPHKKIRTIHIAGTNGKGSTSHMLASILQEAGYKTGLYTSPHLKDFRERIRINGAMISEEEVIQFVDTYQSQFNEIAPSFFEWTVALCFHWFAQKQIDVAVIETGLGGRLDSTNIITPQLSVITNIGWDHMDMLGDTLEKIAFEKAGIIKQNIPVVIGEHQTECDPVYQKRSEEEHAELHFAQDEISLSNLSFEGGKTQFTYNDKAYQCDLGGYYQEKNITTVLAAIHELRNQGYTIHEEHIARGLAQVKKNTGLMGRWQIIGEAPLTVADTGHNVNGIEYIVKQISSQTFERLHMVIGMVRDKDISKVLNLLPKDATYYFCNADMPRALPAADLQAQAANFQLMGNAYQSVKESVAAAQHAANSRDMIFIGGSTFVVAEAI